MQSHLSRAVRVALMGALVGAYASGVCAGESPAASSAPAVAFQLNTAHTGATTFSAVHLPTTPLWQVTLDGPPSYALIAENMVIVTVNISGNSELVALDRNSGTVVWGPIILSGQAAAAYDNGLVFAASSNGLLQAFRASSGRPIWSVLAGETYLGSSAPTAANGSVYVATSEMLAFNETNGAQLWAQYVEGSANDSTPAVTSSGVYVAYPCNAYDLSPSTGQIVWNNMNGCEGGGGATGVVADGKFYAPNGFGTYNGDVFDAGSGKLVFSYVANSPPAIDKTMGYFLQAGTLRGLQISNYSVVWSFTGDGSLSSSPIVVNNVVFIGSNLGNVYGLDGKSGKVLWQVNVGAPVPYGAGWGSSLPLSGLSAGQGLLVIPAGSTLTAYELAAR